MLAPRSRRRPPGTEFRPPHTRPLAEIWPPVRSIWEAEGRAPATFREYETAVRLWCAFWEAGATEPSVGLTDGLEPAIGDWAAVDLLAFRAWLARSRSARTANKHLASVAAICAAAGVSPPRVRPLPTRASPTVYLTAAEVGRLYAAAAAATWPACDRAGEIIDAGLHWQSAIAIWWNYGLRTQELVAISAGHAGLTWRNIFWDPIPPGGGRSRSPFGWLCYTPQKQRRRKPQPLILPMPRIVAEHFRALGPLRPGGTIFDWPRAHKSFATQWRKIVAAAGVQPRADFAADDAPAAVHVSDLRKSCATAHNRNARGVAPLVLGHAPRGESLVTDRHYINADQLLVDAFETFPQPAEFAAILSRNDRQRLLF